MSDANGNPGLKTFSTGAVRSTDAEAVDYTLISPIALRALAETCAYGARKYLPYNAEKGMGARDLLNHALKHVYDFLEGNGDPDDLPHAMWNVGMAIHSLRMWPHLNADLRRTVGAMTCVPPNVDDATAASWDRLRDNLERMKEDVREATLKAVDPWEGKGGYMDGEGTIRFAAGPAPTPTKYALFGVSGERRARCIVDLEFEGCEVADSPWHDDTDASLVVENGDEMLDVVRKYGKPTILIGPCPAGFPEHGKDERWFPSWSSFMQHVSEARAGVAR